MRYAFNEMTINSYVSLWLVSVLVFVLLRCAQSRTLRTEFSCGDQPDVVASVVESACVGTVLSCLKDMGLVEVMREFVFISWFCLRFWSVNFFRAFCRLIFVLF